MASEEEFAYSAGELDDDEEEEEGVDWEDDIDWEQVNLSLADEDAETVTRKRRRPPIRLTKDQKQREKALHQTHLLILLATRIKWTQLSRSQLLRGLLVSLTATSDVDFVADMKLQPLSYSLELLVRCLMNVFFAREGQDYELAVLFAALCGALQLRYRLTCPLDPLLVERGKAFESSFRQRPNKRRRRAQKGAVFWLWCEVLDEKNQNWIHVDAVRRLVNRPQEVESQRGKAARLSYVVSIQDDGLVVDVTSRYTVQWSKSLELRLADSWLKQVIERLNDDTNMEKALVEEKEKLETLKLAEGMPTSLEGFRKHDMYVLERHLSHFECLHPRSVVGLFKGQSVFLREHVQPLRSAFKWRHLGREVKESERQKPAKWQARGNDTGKDSDGAAEEGKSNGSLALFGLWQTVEFEPPPMVDGRVPKNKYGNIEIWSPAHIPRGAVHLCLPRIDAIAESLGIDFAPAVVGFEVRNGRPMPKMSGVVVATSHEEMLLDAHAERQQQTIEKALAHNQKLVLRRWAKLTKRLLLRQRLEDDYGAVN
ncbi:DNA repair protein, putative [Phytophthora infestans T30-4]|uniref:DNA repair protein, putative n=1 Tax=Phytophthora infestans (strain T30-4) TaxID=403677 RepID=D0NFP7_PHYIT|nr:DNA repair protein, putative [Phytophthora infestans T30-4]EEY57036.1 DNA repair protein, putative [Phytophthora infestans T30-4]|eukprot:XP_002902364.1 DNA repair protein, putative [Phytophthora infestans T30-4]